MTSGASEPQPVRRSLRQASSPCAAANDARSAAQASPFAARGAAVLPVRKTSVTKRHAACTCLTVPSSALAAQDVRMRRTGASVQVSGAERSARGAVQRVIGLPDGSETGRGASAGTFGLARATRWPVTSRDSMFNVDV